VDKIIYWGYRHYGRYDARCNFRYNRKDVVMMGLGSPMTFKWKYEGLKQYFIVYYKHNSEIKRKHEECDITSENMRKMYQHLGLDFGQSADLFYDYLGYGKLVRPTKEQHDKRKEHNKKLMSNYKKVGQMVDKPEEIYSEHPSKWEKHFFEDLTTCDLFIPTFSSGLFYQPFVDYFRTCVNIFPYKSDIIDMVINRLQLYQKDLEVESKEKIYHHLDFFITASRKVEETLRYHKIKYQYHDLDKESFDKWVVEPLPNDCSKYIFDKNTHRYSVARKIAEDYVTVRGLTDFRLPSTIRNRVS